MQLKNYQKIAVDKLVKISKTLLAKDGNRVCVLKAPTGSGKTIVVADFLQQLATEQLPNQYAFIWISGNNLHEQSRHKLESYLEASRYTFSYLEDIQDNQFKENEIAFVNWHSLIHQDRQTGEYTNVFMRDNEQDRNLRTYINNTKERGLQIILIVDEAHYHYWSAKSQELVQDVIAPTLTIEVSATPKLEPSGEDIVNEDAGLVSIKFEDVVAEGMIKTEVVINPEIGDYTDFDKAADEAIIDAAIVKQQELTKLYKNSEIDVNPLILIQLPNESATTSALDKTKMEFIEKYLDKQYGISVAKHNLGIWLSERKDNIDTITANDDEVRVLVFKQAIALGWDCPRAQILVMFRDIQSVTFEVQTVGRILRTPEAKHYEENELNRAFVYTNLGKIQIAQDKESKGYFQVYPAHRQPNLGKVGLPSTYLSRLDYGDLTLTFRRLFIEEANKYFGIKDNDFPHVAKDKADKKLDLLPEELTKPVIADAIISQIDTAKDIIGGTVQFSVAEDELKYNFEMFAKLTSLPYAPVRSHTKVQQAIYDWFDNFLGYQKQSRLEIQRIVVCSETNQKIFREIIETAKERFKAERRKEKEARQTKREYSWDVPPIDYFNELYEKASCPNYVIDECFLLKERPSTEKNFEKELCGSKQVKWWYKNRTDKETYFAIPYIHPTDNAWHSFYPDYIVAYEDGSIGIYDTKAGFTSELKETAAKSNALQKYITANKDKKLKGGIVVGKTSGLFVFADNNYVPKTDDKGWLRLEI